MNLSIQNFKFIPLKKIILIDLPESNLLSAFYLKKLFPKKKILFCFLKIEVSEKIFEKYDVLY